MKDGKGKSKKEKLKQFDVILTRDCTQSAQVRVTATDAYEAEERAEDLAREKDLDWEIDEGNDWEVYVTNAEEVDGE